MVVTERRETAKSITGIEQKRFFVLITKRHCYSIVVAFPLDRHGNHTQDRFEQADSHTAIACPQVEHRDTASVVAVVHTEVVLLVETFLDRQYPIEACRSGGGLETPKNGVSDLHPCATHLISTDGDRFTFVYVVGLDTCETRVLSHRRRSLMLFYDDPILGIREPGHRSRITLQQVGFRFRRRTTCCECNNTNYY